MCRPRVSRQAGRRTRPACAIAVILPSLVAPIRTRWIVAGSMGRVVEHQMAAAASPLRDVRRHGRQVPQATRPSARTASRRSRPQCRARTRRMFSLGMPSVLARSVLVQSIIWLDVQSVSLSPLPGGDRGVGLHHGMGLIGRAIGRVELNGRRGEAPAKSPTAGIGHSAARDAAGASLRLALAAPRSNAPLVSDIFHADQLRGGACLLESFARLLTQLPDANARLSGPPSSLAVL